MSVMGSALSSYRLVRAYPTKNAHRQSSRRLKELGPEISQRCASGHQKTFGGHGSSLLHDFLIVPPRSFGETSTVGPPITVERSRSKRSSFIDSCVMTKSTLVQFFRIWLAGTAQTFARSCDERFRGEPVNYLTCVELAFLVLL